MRIYYCGWQTYNYLNMLYNSEIRDLTRNYQTESYPLATLSLGEHVEVKMCSPSGHHSKLVVSGACVIEICFFCFTSQNSKFPLKLPNPARHRSIGFKEKKCLQDVQYYVLLSNK